MKPLSDTGQGDSRNLENLVFRQNSLLNFFCGQVYRFAVPEDAPPRTLVGQIVATDLDSGRFGQVEYALRGFGADRFDVDPITGEISVKV